MRRKWEHKFVFFLNMFIFDFYAFYVNILWVMGQNRYLWRKTYVFLTQNNLTNSFRMSELENYIFLMARKFEKKKHFMSKTVYKKLLQMLPKSTSQHIFYLYSSVSQPFFQGATTHFTRKIICTTPSKHSNCDFI